MEKFLIRPAIYRKRMVDGFMLFSLYRHAELDSASRSRVAQPLWIAGQARNDSNMLACNDLRKTPSC